MSFDKKRRFIAGAVCPRCSAMDRIVVYNHEGRDFRECVACGYTDAMHFQPVVRELDTRVNQTEARVAQETQVLRLVNPDKTRGKK